MCWPSNDSIRCLHTFYARCEMTLLIWKLRPEMLCNLSSCCNRDIFFCSNLLKDLQGGESGWLANAAAMRGDCHHLRESFLPFLIEDVKGTLDMIVEVSWGAETGRNIEFAVVTTCALD